MATLAIIAANVVVTLAIRSDPEAAIVAYGVIPDRLRPGALFTANFIHDGFVHLSINMILLYIFGRDVERAIGKLEFLLFYVGACFAASLVHIAIVFATLPPFYATRAIVGASGAVAAVLGVYAVRFHRSTFRISGAAIPSLLVIMCWLVLQVLFGVLGLYRDDLLGIDLKRVGYWSHLGGFAFGIALALVTNMALQGEREYRYREARRQIDEGNLLEAAQSYESLLKHDPQNPFAHAELGKLWAELEDREQSLPYYEAAIELYSSAGKERGALSAAREMRHYWPDAPVSPRVRFRLATYLEEAGHPKQAIKAFEQIAAECSDCEEGAMSLLKIGQIQLAALQDPNAASDALNRFLELCSSADPLPESNAWRRFAEDLLRRCREVTS